MPLPPSIPVVHFLGEAEEVADGEDGAVVQDGLAAHAAEDLVLVGHQQPQVDFGRPVQDRRKVHLNRVPGDISSIYFP